MPLLTSTEAAAAIRTGLGVTTVGNNVLTADTAVDARSAISAPAIADMSLQATWLRESIGGNPATFGVSAEYMGRAVQMLDDVLNTVNIPTNASAPIPLYSWIDIVQTGTGTTEIEADTGVTLNGATPGTINITRQWGRVRLHKIGTDAWTASGEWTTPA